MSDYAVRALRYRQEFSTQVDFPLLTSLLTEAREPVLDIPCGAGRLLPLYLPTMLAIHMVDAEIAMVSECRNEVVQQGLEHRVFVHLGQMWNWRTPERLGLILVARGGLQMLESLDKLVPTLQNLRDSLGDDGAILVDLHDPWNARGTRHESLPAFMRFSDTNSLAGDNRYPLPCGGLLMRRFDATLGANELGVHFTYVERTQNGLERHYNAQGRWLRIRHADLLEAAGSAGVRVSTVWGDYDQGPFSPGCPRLIALLRKR